MHTFYRFWFSKHSLFLPVGWMFLMGRDLACLLIIVAPVPCKKVFCSTSISRGELDSKNFGLYSHCHHYLQINSQIGQVQLSMWMRVGGEGVTKDEIAGWHHRLNGHEFEQTLRDSEGQGNLVCCSHGVQRVNTTNWGRKKSTNLS